MKFHSSNLIRKLSRISMSDRSNSKLISIQSCRLPPLFCIVPVEGLPTVRPPPKMFSDTQSQTQSDGSFQSSRPNAFKGLPNSFGETSPIKCELQALPWRRGAGVRQKREIGEKGRKSRRFRCREITQRERRPRSMAIVSGRGQWRRGCPYLPPSS